MISNFLYKKFLYKQIGKFAINKIAHTKFAINDKINKPNVDLNDSAFKNVFEKFKSVWNEMSDENESKTKEELEKKLSKEQIKNLELLADKFGDLNEFQIKYHNTYLAEKLLATKKFTLMDVNTNWPNLIEVQKNNPTININELNVNPGFFNQQEFMSDLTTWLSKQKKPDLGLISNSAKVTTVQAEKVEKKFEEKKEEKQEKSVYDVELTSFDAAKKIALIKEVRGFTNLGLKESKELVEKAPTVILKGIKKEETDAIVKKLTDNGAKITLK